MPCLKNPMASQPYFSAKKTGIGMGSVRKDGARGQYLFLYALFFCVYQKSFQPLNFPLMGLDGEIKPGTFFLRDGVILLGGIKVILDALAAAFQGGYFICQRFLLPQCCAVDGADVVNDVLGIAPFC